MLNGQHIKLAKIKGPFVMHNHKNEDEIFLVIKGQLKMELETRSHAINPGEFVIIPRGINHKPIAVNEVEIMLFEPASTINTGNIQDQKTITDLDFI